MGPADRGADPGRDDRLRPGATRLVAAHGGAAWLGPFDAELDLAMRIALIDRPLDPADPKVLHAERLRDGDGPHAQRP